jgi:eukaryotic-like serine/threonine-protein kinase
MTTSYNSASASGGKKTGIITGIIIAIVVLFCLCILVALVGAVFYLTVGRPKGLAPSPTPMRTAPRVSTTHSTNTPRSTPTPTIYVTPTFGPGSIWVRPADGMKMMYVPLGEYTMGSDDGNENERPPHAVTLDDYWIDQTEVTNGMFYKFVTATGYVTDAEKIGQGYVYQPGQYLPAVDKWQFTGGANWLHPEGPSSKIDWMQDYPVVQMSWNDADAYCIWAGVRLPTEAEWEMTARGTDGRVYPWGNQSPYGNLANSADSNLDAIWASGGIDDGYKFTSPVGHYPAGASPFGALDMAGNASEWVADLFQPDYYSISPHGNPLGPESGNLRIMRGGHWAFTADGLRSSIRIIHTPTYSIDYSGFRCARTP